MFLIAQEDIIKNAGLAFGNTHLKLDYDKETGILYAQWPEFGPYMIQHLEEPFTEIINVLISLKIRKFIFDSSHCKNNYSDCQLKQIVELLASGFAQTPLQKLARIQRKNPIYVAKFEKYFTDINNEMGLGIKFKHLDNKAAALSWLNEEN